MNEDFIKDIDEKIKEGLKIDKIDSVVKRCPECHNLSLEFDLEKQKLVCRKCGFSQDILK